MAARYFICAVMLLAAVAVSAQQQAEPAAAPSPAARGYTVFAGGMVIGREDVTVQTTGGALTITSKGRLTGSQDIVIQRAEIRYRADGTAEAFDLEASVNGNTTTLYTTFAGGSATTKGVDAGEQVARTDTVAPQTLILPNIFFASYEALTRRLSKASPGDEFPAFISTGTIGSVRLINSDSERVQIGTAALTVRRYGLALNSPRGVVPMSVYADDSGALVRLSIPGQNVEVMRDDLAAATSRTILHSNPTDEAATIPSAGFNLGATLTMPRTGGTAGSAAPARMPAVILLGSAASNERDGVVGGVPVSGQLAGALADAGFLVVRYDKRGHGQSGGRAESATLTDHADDAVAVYRWLVNRRDVDRDRIAVVGHNEGAWTALLAATRERRIAAVVSIAAPSTAGSETMLERQRHVLDRMNLTPAERVERIEQQRRINAAVLTGKGWEALPADVRKQADTPWFQSVLAFDPARVIRDVRQPVLFIHGDLDAEVPVSHVDRLAEIAQTEGRSRAVAVVTVREVNHLLVPAITGDPREYAALKDRMISADAVKAIAGWLTKSLAQAR